MSILLGAFIVVGLEPGPAMLTEHLDVTFSLVWILVISNIITVLVSLLFLDQLAKITLVRGSLIIPFLILLIVVGAFTTHNDLSDIGLLLFFGALGYVMVLFRWPRPPMILGLVLGGLSEQYLFITKTRYGLDWLLFPGVIIIAVITALALAYPIIQQRRGNKQRGEDEAEV